MKTLFLDLASHHGLLALTTEAAVAAHREIDHRVSDAELFPILEETMREAGWTYHDLTNVACVIGPGGFTSLRVAVTLANTLADQLGIPLASVHLSDVYAMRVMPESRIPLLWLHSTKAHELFVRDLSSSSAKWAEPTHVILEDFLRDAPAAFSWCGELLPVHAEAIAARDGHAVACASTMSILPHLVGGLVYTAEQLAVWYGRTW